MPFRRLSRRFLLVALVSAALVDSGAGASLVNPSTEAKIDALLAQMTLEEKVGQLNQYANSIDLTGPASNKAAAARRRDDIAQGRVGSMLNVRGAEATRATQRIAVEGSRLHVPLLFGYDVIHGYRTIFPVPLGETASWDLAAIEGSAHVAATEAAAAGIHWTFAPMVDIARDARWGRVMEGAGEDPYLGSLVAVARVRGFQGTDLAAVDTIAACAKHFAAYGFVEAGRDYNTVDLSEHTLRNVVLPPFKAAADAGVATFMNAFNEIGGVPSTANAHLQRDILKGEWGFGGFVVSDWGSIREMVTHGVAADNAAAARLAIMAGNDMDMESNAYREALASLVHSGAVPMATVDEAVRRILRVKFALGLFADPYRYCDPERERRELANPAHAAKAREVARESMVLLKNEGALLPLARTLKTIAVIGPLAADKDAPLGNWRADGANDSAVSLLEGVKAAVGPGTSVLYAEGAPLGVGLRGPSTELSLNTTDRSGFAAAVDAAKKADAVILALGEDGRQTGEARSQADIGLKGVQLDLLREVCAANRRVVVVLMNGRPLILTEVAARAPALLETWFLGSEAGRAIADVLFGDYAPSGKLPMSFPRAVGQLPLYYNHKNTGRPRGNSSSVYWSHYTDEANTPLYPFGYGLSYTTFSYSDVRLSAKEIAAGKSLDVAVTVKNTGARPGTEVVQVYVRDLVGSVTRPVKELKAFRRIELQPGEAKDVTFTLTAADLAFYTAAGRWEAEPGEFQVFVGGSSDDVKEAAFTLR
jgi:beta-glucosidase